MPSPKDRHVYAFIDAAYLCAEMKKAMENVFGEAPMALDLDAMNLEFGAEKIFYYDCVDDKKDGHEAFLQSINEQDSVQVRTGTLIAGRRRRQKEVDVLLTVDALSHAHNGNLNRAVIVAGDLDFRPLIDALVRAGVYVELYSSPQSSSRPLAWSADRRIPLDFHRLLDWATPEFRADHTRPFPLKLSEAEPRPGARVAIGEGESEQVAIIRNKQTGRERYEAYPADDVTRPVATSGFGHKDIVVLKRYLDMLKGPFEWGD